MLGDTIAITVREVNSEIYADIGTNGFQLKIFDNKHLIYDSIALKKPLYENAIEAQRAAVDVLSNLLMDCEDVLTVEELMKLHPELSTVEAVSLLVYANDQTIYLRGCYGDGSIIYPMWKKLMNKL